MSNHITEAIGGIFEKWHKNIVLFTNLSLFFIPLGIWKFIELINWTIDLF